jgi:hypothetical protein
MVVRGTLVDDRVGTPGSPSPAASQAPALFLVETSDASQRIAVRPRATCAVDAHHQSVLVRGIFRTHGVGAFMLDSARLCVP